MRVRPLLVEDGKRSEHEEYSSESPDIKPICHFRALHKSWLSSALHGDSDSLTRTIAVHPVRQWTRQTTSDVSKGGYRFAQAAVNDYQMVR